MVERTLSAESGGVKNNKHSWNHCSLVGRKFGRLTVISLAGKSENGRHELYWRCLCDCGKEITAKGHLLKTHQRVSCGCGRVKHGWCRRRRESVEHHTWRKMIDRCANPKAHNFARYGGRGITVCERWMVFENFLADMGQKPSPHLSIERIDNDKGYAPDNCKWATQKEQRANQARPKTHSRRSIIGKPRRIDATSKFKGVSFVKKSGDWVAFFKPPKQKSIWLGSFEPQGQQTELNLSTLASVLF